MTAALGALSKIKIKLNLMLGGDSFQKEIKIVISVRVNAS